MAKYTKEDIQRLAKEENVKFIRLQFTDILGTIKNVEIPISQLEKALDNKMMFDGSSIEGFVRIEESDMYLYPDLNTWVIFPWTAEKGKVARLICDIYTPEGEPFAGDPRNNLKRVLKEMEELGFTNFNLGPEPEFFLFKLDEKGEPTLELNDNGGYFDLAPTDLGENCRRDIVLELEEMGFEIEASHHEVAPGQHEIDFKYADALTACDQIQTFKLVVKTIARKHGLHATFMPKPLFGVNGSGMHCNLSLFTNEKNAFKKKALIPSGFTPAKKEQPKTEQTALLLDNAPIAAPETTMKKEMFFDNAPAAAPRPFKEEITWGPQAFPEVIQENQPSLEAEINSAGAAEEPWEFNSFEPEAAPIVEEEAESRVPPLYPIGQMHGTYIFAENEKGLYIIDQHAAQERLKYEYLREKVGRVESELQDMLIPFTLEYSTDDYLKIIENKDELKKVGVFLEEFGLNSFIVRSHPQWLPKGEEKETIEEMIEQLLSMKKVDIKKLREEAAIMMSCKGSIKANRHLRNDEIQTLLNDLRKAIDPFTCPHGRPIIIQFSTYDLEKMFKRVM